MSKAGTLAQQGLLRQLNTALSASLFTRLSAPTAFAVVVFLAYRQILSAPFMADDFTLLTLAATDHFDLSILTVLPDWLFYRPLGRAVWLITYQLWGDNVTAYHAVSLLLHWLNSLLVVALFSRLLPRPKGLAIVAGLLFALLPLQVEAVAWLSCQHDLLATAGYLTTLLCLLAAWQRSRPQLYLLSLLTFQLTLWAKELAFSLPLMVLMLGLLIPNRPRLRTAVVSAAPYALLVGINLSQRYLTWGSIGGYPNTSSDYPSFMWSHIASTLATLLAPLNQLLFPPWLMQIWMLLMAAVVLAGLLAARNHRLVLLALAWVIIGILPVLNILPVAADLQNSRFLYLSSVGFALGLTLLVYSVAAHLPASRPEFLAYGGAAALGTAYFLLLQFHLQPWLIAGRESVHIVEQLHRIRPAWSSGSLLQVAGLPDNYQGAYIFRNGLSRSMARYFGSTFGKLDRVDRLPPMHYPGEDVLQVAMDFDPTSLQWQIRRARGVSSAAAQMPSPDETGASWDFTACNAENGWTSRQAQARCEQGTGLELAPAGGLVELTSPFLALPAGVWTEVILDMSIRQHPVIETSARIFWTTLSLDAWQEDNSLMIDLPRDTGLHRYHFYIPPGSPIEPILRLRLQPLTSPGTALIRNLTLRPLP